MDETLSIEKLYGLFVDHFGAKIQFPYIDDERMFVGGVIYETFEIRCHIDDHYGSFGVSVRVGPELATSEFFGRRLSRDSDAHSVRASLDVVDRWCRAHLPTAFLTEYDVNITAAPGRA